MKIKKTGVSNSRLGQTRVRFPRLTTLVPFLLAVLGIVGLPGCAAYTTANMPSTGSKSLSSSPTNISFGSVSVGGSATQSVTFTNSGTASVTVSQASISGTAFTITKGTPLSSIAVGQGATLQIQFAPSSSGNLTGSLTITSDANNSPTTVALSGTGATATAQLTGSPSSLSFGNVNVGASSSLEITLTNSGNSNVTISSVNASGAGYSASGVAANTTLTPGQTATLNVAFAPTAAGNVTGSVSVSSNASNSPTIIALSGTGATATAQLSTSPSSLSFGNVNVGLSSSLGVTLTNSGNSSVTISNVTANGTAYTASGVSANTTLAPRQTATLNVTFAPTVAGSATGSVSVASNASNSPATISLSGSGVAQSASGAPTCGRSGDTSNHIPTDWTTFTPPGKGQSYVDLTFGCTVTRITDASKDVWTGSFYLPLSMGYATVSPFNANDSYLMVGDGWARRFVTDLSGNVVVPLGNVPGGNNGWYLWDATNAQVFYYTSGNSLMKGTISGSTVTASTLHQFSEYAAINFMDETDVSQDGAHVVVIGGDTSGTSPEQIFDYNFVTNSKGPVYTTGCTGSVGSGNNGCLHKLIQTPDNNVIIQFASDGTGPEQGNRLWTGSGTLPHLQDGTNHLDAGSDLSGNAVYISSVNGTSLSGATNPCPSGWGLDVRQIYNPTSAVCLLDNQPSWHVGYRGSANQPWVGLSFFDSGRSPSPEWFDNASNYTGPNASTWQLYEDEILVVRIDANNNSNYVYRLARGYSRSNEDFGAQPHAAISRSGKYIAFTSNMAYAHSGCPANFQTATNCADVYIIRVY